MKTKYKHLIFTETPNPKRKTRRFFVFNHHTDCDLGYVEWDRGWRQYIYLTPQTDVPYKFSQGCLDDISHFINQLASERKKTKGSAIADPDLEEIFRSKGKNEKANQMAS